MTTGDADTLTTGSVAATTCVIPAWNASATIMRALQSALATPGIGEVIVVDDGSSDDTGALVEAISATAEIPVQLIRQQNSGAAAARNRGIQAVGLDWVTFLDADDEMLPEAITSKVAFLATCPDPGTVDAVYGSFLRGDTGRVSYFIETSDQVQSDRIGRAGGFPGGVVSYVFRRESLQATVIGRGVILNTACSVDHDCTIGDFAHVSPGAHLAGGVSVGERSWIGIGAVVREGVRIGSDVVVAAGAAVVNDVDNGSRVGGVPARRI